MGQFDFSASRGEFHIFGRRFRLPASRGARIALGLAFLVGGVFSFLPILGLWMIPVGLLILSLDIAIVRNWRRSFVLWLGRRRRRRARQAALAMEDRESEISPCGKNPE